MRWWEVAEDETPKRMLEAEYITELASMSLSQLVAHMQGLKHQDGGKNY